MPSLDALVEAFNLVFTVQVLLWLIVGLIIGIAVGAMPGLTAGTAMAVALPLTLLLPIAPALGLLIGIYKGGIYGGSITAILFAIPGTSVSAATVYDGHKLARRGQSRKALEMALSASVTGDTLSDLFTIFVAPMVAVVALMFDPTERFWLVILAILLIGALTGVHFMKGLISAAIGVFIASIGSDPMFGVARMTFGQWWLVDGIGLIPLVVGIFAMPVIFRQTALLLTRSRAGKAVREDPSEVSVGEGPRLTLKEYLSTWKELAIGTSLGTVVGMLPGLGATPGAFLSYGVAKQASPEKNIGSGKLEGIAAAESGNNATCGPTLVPLLAFGIPGSGGAALLGAALFAQGVTPSPRMFDLFPEVVYGLFMILLVANVLNFGIGLFFARVFARIAQLPYAQLMPLILMLCVLGTFATRGNPFDVPILLALGLIGYIMNAVQIPSAPLVIAYLISPMADENLRRALIIARGDWPSALLGSPLALGLMVVAILSVFAVVQFMRKTLQQNTDSDAKARSGSDGGVD